MQIDSELLDNKAIKVTLDGRLDIAGAEAIDLKFTALTATKNAAVLVDMSQVSFLASIGIRLLLSNAKACSLKGGKMVLFDVQPMVKDVLTSSGVATLIPILDDEQAAMDAVSDVAPK
jgi:anti-anti-sigma factor